MEARRKVCIYGNSVILGSLRTSLQGKAQFNITTFNNPLKQGRELQTLNPDVILFDLEAARPVAAFSLLESHPGLMLIGISPDANVVKIWSGQQLRELSTPDLMKAIERQLDYEEALEDRNKM